MGTRSYLAEQAMADATVRPGPDDGRVVVNVNCGACNGAGFGGYGAGFGGYGAGFGGFTPVVPSLPGLWPLPPASYGSWLPPGFVFGAPPALAPPLLGWSPYVANPACPSGA